MREVLMVEHEHRGHKFEIHVILWPSGYNFFTDFHFSGVESLRINSGDDVYKDSDKAYYVALSQAWEIIEKFVNAYAL